MKNLIYKLLGKKLYYKIRYYPIRVWKYKSFLPSIHKKERYKFYRVRNSFAKIKLIAKKVII